MSGRYDGAVMLVVKSCTAEVDEPDFCVTDESEVLLLLAVVDLIVGAVIEEDVFRLEVRVGETVVVQELDCVAQLVGDLSHLFDRVGHVVVVLEKVEDGRAEHLEDETHVTVKVEPVQHLNTTMLTSGVVFCKLFQNVDL